MVKKITQIILAVVIVGLIYVLYGQIATPIAFENELAKKKAGVVERIKDVRTAQRAYKTKNAKFTNNFDTLINFILNDSLEMERKIVDEDDSVGMAQLKKQGLKNVEKFKIAVIDTIFSPRKLTAEQVKDLRYIPFTNSQTQFIIGADTIKTESGVTIPVVEVAAPYVLFLDTVAYYQNIVNLIDDEVHNFNRYPGVKFGSMESGNNEAGNWE